MGSLKKVNTFKRSLYNIKNLKNLSTPEIKETDKNLLELQKNVMIMMTPNTKE